MRNSNFCYCKENVLEILQNVLNHLLLLLNVKLNAKMSILKKREEMAIVSCLLLVLVCAKMQIH